MSDRLQFSGSQRPKSFDEETATKILNVAARLQDEYGDRIDEARLASIAEEAGVRPEYVRLAMEVIEEEQDRTEVKPRRKRVGLLARLRRRYDETAGLTRSIVNGALAGAVGAIGWMLFGEALRLDPLSVVVIWLGVILGIIATYRSRSPGHGAMSGLSWGLSFSGCSAILATIFNERVSEDPVIGSIISGALVGTIVGGIGAGTTPGAQQQYQHGPHAVVPIEDRQELLRQLYAIQDRLRQGTQHATFLSVDVVDSTSMKSGADPLAVEYSFSAYHRYVAEIAHRFSGQVHSTAGDGVTCVFGNPEKAYQAARMVQRNLVQFNSAHNRIGSPFVLRCGIHSGTVVAPTGDLRGVEFSHVIDLAARLQKHGPPGGIILSQSSVAGIYDPVLRLGLAEATVDGQPVAVYRPAPYTPAS
jgi:class 3 adenylate cyclase